MNKTDFNLSYIGHRADIQRLISPNAKSVLDVGCSTGMLGASIKAKTRAKVFGIELSEEMANQAVTRLDKVFVGDAEEILCQGMLDGQQFDTIVFADVLEHLVNPWAVLRKAVNYLHSDGTIVASIPNIRHIDTIYHLVVKGYWPYRERGIHDQTHLRFFTRRNIVELFENAGLAIDRIETNYRIFEKPHTLNRFSKFLAFPGIRNFLAFQYLIRAHRDPSPPLNVEMLYKTS
jgi:2-polyprenyl-3-methyl-5-hydroxy-6-metoxy-1,4-benzoquinol methylase